MPRGSNSQEEQDRIKADEIANTRSQGKQGAGTTSFEKTGFGGGSAQKNPASPPKESL